MEPTDIDHDSGQDIFNIFSQEEKDGIEEPVKKKLEGFWSNKSQEITRLKVENDKIKINADQEKFNHERELVTLKGELEEERALREEATQSKESNETRIVELEDQLGEAKTKVISLTRELQQTQNEQESASSQSAAMAGSLETRTLRINELQEQVNLLEEQLNQASRSKCDAIMKAEEAASKELKAQYREKRLEQEKSLLSRQVEVLQNQIQKRADENLEQRRDHSSKLLNLQSSLNLCKEELRVAKEEMELNQKQIEEKTHRINDLLTSLNGARESEIKLDEMYREELGAQKKLAEIYEGSAKDEEERCKELEKGLEEHRQLLQSASEQYGLLERKKEQMENEHSAEVDKLAQTIKQLKDELEKANVLISTASKKDSTDMTDLSASAAAASNLINRGLSLTQVYSEYITVCEKLHTAEEENKRLQRYVDEILAEIEARVPVFKKQRENHQQAVETANSLHAQLERCQDKMDKQTLEYEEAIRKRNYLEKETERCKQEIKDLSMQVTVLVTQVEAARLGQPPPPVPRDLSSISSGSDVISDHLVAFRNVAELQDQNKMLRASLRKLSEDMDANDSADFGGKAKKLEEELELVKTKLTGMQEQRERQEALLDNVVKQRDMYKTLCDERSPRAPKTPPVKQPPQMFGVPHEEVQKLQKELDDAFKRMEEMKKEHQEYREESKKNHQMQHEEYNRLRTRMDNTLSENVKLLSQAEFNEERLKSLTHNSEVLQRQIAALQNNNSALQGIVGRHESTIEGQHKEFMSVQKEYSRCQVNVEHMREEIKLLKECEARLIAEREFNSKSQAAQAIVLSNLETIKTNLEKTDTEKTIRLENQVQDLSEKCSRLQTKLDANTDFKEAQAKLTVSEGVVKSLQNENKSLIKQANDAQAELIILRQRLKDTQERVRTPITSPTLRGRSPILAATSPTPGGPTTTPVRSGGPQLRDLQVQLNEEKAKAQNIQTSLDQSKKQIEELLELTKKQEKQLKDSSETYKTSQEQFKKLKKERDEMESMMTKLQTQLSNITADSENTKLRMQTMLNEAKDEIQAAEKRLKDANESFQKAKEQEDAARKEALTLNEKSIEVQSKYETEVMLHGTDLKTLAELKKKQAAFDSEFHKVSAAKTKAEEAVRDTRLGFEKRENMLRRENKDLMVRAHELEEQNKSLVDKFTQLSDKMAALQSKLSSSNQSSADGAANVSFSEEEARSSDQLREVIKYLRREREVAAGKCEVAEAESQRLVAQKKLLESRIESLSKDLAEERVKNKTSLDSASNYGELMRKVNTFEALSDSNQLMREEKERIEAQAEEFKAKAEVLQKQIEPMNERHKNSLNKIEALMLEKKSLESEKDLYVKRTQDLVEKLNQAKPEDFIKLQQNNAELQKNMQVKESELDKLRSQLQHVQKSLQMTNAQKNLFNNQLQSTREESTKNLQESKKVAQEKARLQQQIVEENKKYTIERTRLQQQLTQTQEKVRSLESTAQQSEANHQQEMRKLQEQFSREKHQLQENKEQALEFKGREDQFRHQMEIAKKEKDEIESQLEEERAKVSEYQLKAENLEKTAVQLRKIANKYKKQADSLAVLSPGAPDTGEEGVQPPVERIRELEEGNQTLRQKLEASEKECQKYQQEISELKETIKIKESEMQNTKTQSHQKEAELSKLRSDLEMKKRELQQAQMISTQLQQTINKQIPDLQNRLEESLSKKQVSESRLIQYEKEREQHLKDIEMLNKKLQMQQRQIENLQKQASGTSKPSTSGVSSEKSTSEPPPTANIKPLNPPVTPSASPRLQTATQVVPPSRPIPTASIRPMAPPPSGGSAPPQGSTVVVVSPLETHSDGMVSSTVTLPQATVTPTPAISTPTLLTTATTTPASTLTATVSPTPASASITTPVAPATATVLSSITGAQSSSQTLIATQSTSVSQSSVSQSAAAAMEVSGSQSTGANQSGSSVKTTVAPTSSMAAQSTIGSKSSMQQQPSTGSTSVIMPLVSVTGGTGSTSKLTMGVQPSKQQQQQDLGDVSADALISQAIALVTPLSSQESAGPSGVNVRKRKGESPLNPRDVKCSRVEEEEALSSEEAGPSSSFAAARGKRKDSRLSESDDVILLDSDEDERPEDYPDQDDEDDDDEDGHMEEQDGQGSSRGTESDEDMEHEDSSREASEGFEAGQETREAQGTSESGEADAGVSSEVISESRRDQANTQERQSERPQPSAGTSQPSSSSQGNEASSQSGSRLLARPILRQERLGGVARQNLPPFSQLPQYEEAGGDDSIVPSTPTLFVPRRDGFSEAVSSPQVPSSGFVFGGNPVIGNPNQRGGLAQMAEGGLIDDTRIDLGQLDEGNRSQTATPLHRSPSAAEVAGVSTSERDSLSARDPPTVVITRAEQSNDEDSQGSVEQYTEADSMAVTVEDDEEEEEDADEEEDQGEEEEEEDEDEDNRDEDDDDDDEGDMEEQDDNDDEGHQEFEDRGSSDDGSQPPRGGRGPGRFLQRRTPITWDDIPARGRTRGGPSMSRGPRGLINRSGIAPTGSARRSRGRFISRGRLN